MFILTTCFFICLQSCKGSFQVNMTFLWRHIYLNVIFVYFHTTTLYIADVTKMRSYRNLIFISNNVEYINLHISQVYSI